MTWTSAASVSRLAWGQVTPIRGPDGVDFVLEFSDAAPMLLSADRPLLCLSSISQGNP